MHKVSAFFFFALIFFHTRLLGAQSLDQKDLESFLARVHWVENRLAQIDKDNEAIFQQQEKILAGLEDIRNQSRRVGSKKT